MFQTVAISYEMDYLLHASILNLISYYTAPERILAITNGVGQWQNMPEEAGVILLTVEDIEIPHLRDGLAQLAHIHGQSTIGFIAAPSDTTLIPAHKHVQVGF